MGIRIFEGVIAILALTVPVLFVCGRLKIPSIVGFLFTGVLVGPFGLKALESKEQVEVLAEIGVVLLMFTIGAEFSLRKLLHLRQLVLVGGLLQVTLTTITVALCAQFLGLPVQTAILVGFLAAFSSTVLVLKLLSERAELDSLHGRTAFAILIFQDLIIVPLMILLPLFSPGGQAAVADMGPLLRGVGMLALLTVGLWFTVPRILAAAVASENRELFLLTVITICFAVAILAHKCGLSFSIGALLAGLIISESPYSHDALNHILPFQQVFSTIFFVSVGMLVDLSFVADNWAFLLCATLGIIVLKTVLTVPAGLALGFSLKVSVLTGLALAQVGEFSLVLAAQAVLQGSLPDPHYQLLLAVTVLSIALTPYLMHFSPAIAGTLSQVPLPAVLAMGWKRLKEERHLMGHEPLAGHAIIVGYGTYGELVAKIARTANIPFTAIDNDPDLVEAKRLVGEPVVLGDANNTAVLDEEGIRTARLLFIALADAVGTRHVVSMARAVSADLNIIVCNRFPNEESALRTLGATTVVPQDVQIIQSVVGKSLGAPEAA